MGPRSQAWPWPLGTPTLRLAKPIRPRRRQRYPRVNIRRSWADAARSPNSAPQCPRLLSPESLLASRSRAFSLLDTMSATKILWGQVILVGAVVLVFLWAATEWTAWRLAFQPELGRPWFSFLAGRSIPASLLLVVVCRSTPMRTTSSSKAALSPHPAGSPLRRGGRHVGLARPGGQEASRPMAPLAGPSPEKSATPVFFDPDGVCSAAGIAPIFAMMARSMCCASRRPAAAKASALSFRRC